MKKEINANLRETETQLRKIFEKSFDAVIRTAESIDGRGILLLFFDGLVDKDLIHETVLAPFLGFSMTVDAGELRNLEEIRRRLLTSVDISPSADFEDVLTHVLSGDTAVFVDLLI